jgi:hypothetical protein
MLLQPAIPIHTTVNWFAYKFPLSLYNPTFFLMQFVLLAACLMLVSCLAYSLNLKMEVICSFETPLDLYQHFNPEVPF